MNSELSAVLNLKQRSLFVNNASLALLYMFGCIRGNGGTIYDVKGTETDIYMENKVVTLSKHQHCNKKQFSLKLLSSL